MSLIDFILNLAGLLLWFKWRAGGFDPLTKLTSISLANTIKRESASRSLQWLPPAALLALVCGRAVFYWLVGPAVDWTGSLDLGPITIFMRTEQFWLALLFSTLSFARTLVLVYFWLLALCIINRNMTEPDVITGLIRLQLSCAAKWPVFVQAALPLFFVAAAWPGMHALLTHAGVTSSLPSVGQLLLQGCLIGLGTFFTLKYLILLLLFADLLARYIYFGHSPVWDFLNATARNILTPLQRLPLRAGRMDFAPLVGIALTILLLHVLPRLVMLELHRRNLTLWPH